jgi:diacylglycerol kinase (ATP)
MERSSRRAILPWISERRRSFVFAFRGLAWVWRESNARIHAAMTAGVIGSGLVFGISALEWALMAFAITLVWVAETVNTAFEILADAVVPGHNPLIGTAKDVTAGAVLIAAIGAAAVGTVVLLPRLLAAV